MTATTEFSDRRMPVLYLSHGAPPLADDPLWTRQLADWSHSLPRPSSVLIVSAHWEEDPLTIGATATVPLLYDFWGFPDHYYRVTYPAPGAPDLAAEVRKLLGESHSVNQDPTRGLDHGAYVPLVEMYPEADVPVLQMSMPTLDPQILFEVGRKLSPLRDQGVLIVGSGFSTHNLREMNWHLGPDAPPPTWSSEFDDWLDSALAMGDVDSLLDFERTAPAAHIAHPRTEHFAPLFVSLGASLDSGPEGRSAVEGFWFGLSKRSVQFD
ncbi:MAG TPA: class III extradiol ring-cleavage dioxygenase [Acidimicrobiia bacterium]|nr:class III extradiol ring-cleavage dioxygenase [Acidimicrobiia bacterium]